jgi:hypothetical protein
MIFMGSLSPSELLPEEEGQKDLMTPGPRCVNRLCLLKLKKDAVFMKGGIRRKAYTHGITGQLSP